MGGEFFLKIIKVLNTLVSRCSQYLETLVLQLTKSNQRQKKILKIPERGAVEEALGCVNWTESSSEVVLEAAGSFGLVLLRFHHRKC